MDFTKLVNSQAALQGQMQTRTLQHLEGRDLEALAAGKTPEEQRAALKKASEEFEAIFAYQMVAAMRTTVSDGGMVEKSNGEKIFESMLDEEWAKKLTSQTGSQGLAKTIYQQLGRQLGVETETLPAKDERGFMPLSPQSPGALPLHEQTSTPLQRDTVEPMPLQRGTAPPISLPIVEKDDSHE